MTDADNLLDEATRLAGVAPPGSAAEHILATPRVLRALVERVREAEADESEQSDEADYWVGQLERAEAERQEWANLWQKASMSVLTLQGDAETLTRERDAARAKLDKVRAWLDDVYDDGTEWRDLRRLRAILDA